MNAHEEEKIQRDLENGKIPVGDPLEVRSYQEVFRTLRQAHAYELPADFAERVVSRVLQKQRARQRWDYFWFASGLLLLMLAFVATVAITGFKPDLGFLSVMADYKGLAIFAIAFIGFINWVDKRLIRKNISI